MIMCNPDEGTDNARIFYLNSQNLVERIVWPTIQDTNYYLYDSAGFLIQNIDHLPARVDTVLYIIAGGNVIMDSIITNTPYYHTTTTSYQYFHDIDNRDIGISFAGKRNNNLLSMSVSINSSTNSPFRKTYSYHLDSLSRVKVQLIKYDDGSVDSSTYSYY